MPDPLGQRPDQHDDSQGFTLIELMVVVLIIAILLAIAIPTFLGARDRANDRSAETNLRHAITAEKTLYTDSQTYADSSAATGASVLTNLEPALSWTAPSATMPNHSVSATLAGTTFTVVLQALSASRTCFYIADIAPPDTPAGTYYASNSNTNGSCTATPPAPPVAQPTLVHADGIGTHWALAF